MNKAEFKEKRKKLLEQRVRPTEGTEAVSAWDYDFNDSNEVLQSGEVELLENMTSIVLRIDRRPARYLRRNGTRHGISWMRRYSPNSFRTIPVLSMREMQYHQWS